MNEEEKRQFFASRPNPYTVNMGGKKIALANFPLNVREKIIKRLAEKDPVMAKGREGILPGIKINGKEVTKDNLSEFEKKTKGGK